MFNNYISVSFQIGGTVENTGCVLARITGKSSFEELKSKISSWAKDKYGYDINPNDINITGISEISRNVYKHLVR